MKNQHTLKIILRYSLLVFGIILTFDYYYNFLSISKDVNSWGPIFVFIGLLVVLKRSWVGFGLGSSSVNGIGTTLYGKREIEPDGSYVATKWFIFLLLPIFPLGSYRVLPDKPKMEFLTQVTNYRRYEKVSLNKRQVLHTYLLIYGFIFTIFVLPFLI